MKKFKKIIAACLAAITTMSVSAFTASASEAELINVAETGNSLTEEIYNDGFSLVSQEEFTDEDDIIYKVCLYERDEGISTASNNARTTKRYKATLTGQVSVQGRLINWVDMRVEASFTWDGDEYIYVDEKTAIGEATSRSAGFSFVGDPTFVCLPDQGSNFLFGNKYAIAKLDVTMTNGFANTRHKFHLYIDVNVKGQPHVDPRKGPILEEV